MDELVVLIEQRIQRYQQLLKQTQPNFIRQSKQEQKIRCQKEAFIISIIKSNKISNLALRKSFYNESYKIMKKIRPSFQLKLSSTLQSTFLNDFVVLYTQFFQLFQSQFIFKTKIHTFLRPTNHNLVTDLIKYLVDFTRDYFLQILFWKNKTTQLALKNQQVFQSKCQQEQINRSNLDVQKSKNKTAFQNSRYMSKQMIHNISSRKKSQFVNQEKKSQISKIYDIMGISNISSLLYLNKDSTINLQSLKIRINQFYRQQKSRNSQIRQIYQQYYQIYNEKKGLIGEKMLPYYQTYKRTKLNRLIQPFKLLLTIQKNCFSYINVIFDPKNKFYQKQCCANSLNTSPDKIKTYQKIQNNSLSPLKISKRSAEQYKIDSVLTSMKILKISESFLPPLELNNTSEIQKIQSQNKKHKLSFSLKTKRTYNSQNIIQQQKQSKDKNQIKKIQFVTNYNHRSNRLIKIKDSRVKPLQYEIIQNVNRESQKMLYMKQPTEPQLNQSLQKKQTDPKKRYLQFSQQKKMFKTQKTKCYKEEEKILQWLQKIKKLKQMERKKILGMNY